jgi:glycopeptide antibiotics resistance protein
MFWKPHGVRNKIKVCIIAYGMVIVFITLLSRDSSFIHTYKLVPLYSYREVVKGNLEAFRTVILNVGLFIPFGYFLFSFGKRKRRAIIISFIFSAGIELIQFLTGRGLCEVDDVISNTIGAVIGIVISATLKDRFSRLLCILFLAGGLIAGKITVLEPKDTIYEKQFSLTSFQRLPMKILYILKELVTLMTAVIIVLRYG